MLVLNLILIVTILRSSDMASTYDEELILQQIKKSNDSKRILDYLFNSNQTPKVSSYHFYRIQFWKGQMQHILENTCLVVFCGIKLSIIIRLVLSLHFKNNAYKWRSIKYLTKSIPENKRFWKSNLETSKKLVRYFSM